MIKAMMFDLDNTLCPISKQINPKVLNYLNYFASKNILLCIISGKPLAYLIGLCRQAGLDSIYLYGESGLVASKGCCLPPPYVKYYGKSQDFEKIKRKIKKQIENESITNIYYQPNEVELTIFFYDNATHKKLKKLLNSNSYKKNKEIEVFDNIDSFDVVPKFFDKGSAFNEFAEEHNLKTDEIAAIGDSENDYPMLIKTKNSFGIQMKEKLYVSNNFSSIESCMEFLKKEVDNDPAL